MIRNFLCFCCICGAYKAAVSHSRHFAHGENSGSAIRHIMDFINSFGSVKLDFPPLETFMIPAGPRLRIPSKPRDATDGKFFYPFEANPFIFELSMSPVFIFTFVSIYVISVLLLNQFNTRRDFQSWAFSRTSIFRKMVITHNALLAIFSAWSIWGMIYTVRNHWRLARSELAIASTMELAEFMCQIDMGEYRGMP